MENHKTRRWRFTFPPQWGGRAEIQQGNSAQIATRDADSRFSPFQLF